MTYLLTGYKGFIGTNLIKYLHKKRESAIGLDYGDCDLCEGLPKFCHNYPIDTIIHLAAETSVRTSIEKPVSTILRNTESTVNLLELAREKKAKFIFVSSCGARYLSSPYAASKMAGEAICESYRESYGMDIVILRLPNIYGPHSLHKSSVIPQFIKALLFNKSATIYGDGTQTRNFVFVSDICKAIYEATEDMELTTGELTSIKKLSEIVGCKVKYAPAVKGEVTKVSSVRNICPEFSLEQGITETIKWFRYICTEAV